MTTSNYYLLELSSHDDCRGKMCVCESFKEIPFLIQRLFFDFDNKPSKESRGNHANVNSEFVFICLHGSCTIRVNDGFSEDTFVLNTPKKALYVNKMVWKEMFNFSNDSVLLVLSNCSYDSKEYICDFDEFLKKSRGELL